MPALYFAFIAVRIFASEMYEDYALYLLDVNYHFGHVFVAIHDAVGVEPGIQAQLNLASLTGVYAVPEEEPETVPESLELVEHVPLEVSVLLLALLGVGALAVSLYRFQRMDV